MKVGAIALVSVLVLSSIVGSLSVALPPASRGVATVAAPSTSVAQSAPSAPGVAPSPISMSAPSGKLQALPLSAQASRILNAVTAAGVPSKYVYLPNLNDNTNPTLTSGHVNISFKESPAPMGIAEFGLNNSTGVLKPFTLNSTSVRGTFDSGNLTPLYLDDGAPRAYGIQLNAVLNNVTLFNNDTFQFWTQNVVFYIPDAHTLQFLDNIWNFSNIYATLSPNFAYQVGKNGTVVAPEFYYASGPIVTVQYPFDLGLYVNSTMIGGRDAVYFNYTLTYANLTGVTKRFDGSFDRVIFNSRVTYGPPASIPAHYEVNGKKYNPLGLVDDWELALGGPGGGSTTSIFSGSATMSLQYLNSSTGLYSDVPTAWNAGGDTGETVEGASVFYQGTTVEVAAGPSIVGGLWGMGVPVGGPAIHVTLSPSNAFMFVGLDSQLVYGGQFWAWTPPELGTSLVLHLSPGAYTAQFDLSGYDPQQVTFSTLSGGVNLGAITLTPDPSTGMYTPLWAFSNSQLSAISSKGSGTLGNPFVLDNSPTAYLPQFGMVNDYLFPVFPAVFLSNTTDYVLMNAPVTYQMTVPPWYVNFTAHTGLPRTWYLQIEFFEAQHVSLINAPNIVYWDYYVDGGFESGTSFSSDGFNVIFWNSTNNLIAHNNFTVEAQAIYMYNGFDQPANNTIWGNTFTEALPPAAILGYLSASYVSLYEAETHDVIYNNFFGTGLPAISPSEDPYWGGGVAYKDVWNTTYQPARQISDVVNGYSMNGSILLQKWQCGNYWSSYGSQADPFGKVPVNVYGFIAFGGDYCPLFPFPVYQVTMTLNGLPTNQIWTLTETTTGLTFTSHTPVLDTWWPNGTYDYSYVLPTGYVGSLGGEFNITGAALFINRTVLNEYAVIFQEAGLPTGTTWSVTLKGNGQSFARSISRSNTTFLVAPSTYTWTVKAAGFTTQTPSGTIHVSSQYPIFAAFSKPPPTRYLLSFTEKGLPTGAPWSVWVNGAQWTGNWTGSSSAASRTLTNGSYTYGVAGPSGYTLVGSITGTATISGHANTVPLTFQQNVVPTMGQLVLTITPVPASYTIYIGGSPVGSSGGVYQTNMTAGNYSLEIVAPGYFVYWGNVSVSVGTTTTLQTSLTVYSGGGGNTNNTNASGTVSATYLSPLAYGIAGALGIGVVIFAAFYMMSRSRPSMTRPRPGARPPVRPRPRTGAPPVRRPGAPPAASRAPPPRPVQRPVAPRPPVAPPPAAPKS